MINKHYSLKFFILILFVSFLSASCGTEETCIDGVQNQDETAVDCGGVCQACISCSDGIQNGDETGVDCGGSCADVCSIVANLETFTTTNSGLPDNYIHDVEMVGNVVWVATNEGAASYDGTTWTIFNTSNSSLPHNEVRDIFVGNFGILWFATWGGGVAQLDNGVWTVWNSSVSGVPSEIDYCDHFTQVINWTVVAAPSQGFLIWDGSVWTSYTTANSNLPSDQISDLVAGPNGEIYLTTLDAGLIEFNLPNFTEYNSSNSGLPDNELYSIHSMGNGEYWMGSKAGLVINLGSNWSVFQTSNSEIRGDVAKTLWIDVDDNIWLTALGLSKFDGAIWTHYTEANSSADLFFANDIAIGADGRHWVGTQDRGLISFE